MWKYVLRKWKKYRYRFVPWIALHLKDRTVRSIPKGGKDKLVSDGEIKRTLIEFFTSLEGHTAGTRRQDVIYMDNLQAMWKTLGFKVERQTSSLSSGGTGVFVTDGHVPKHTVVSMYPGAVYLPGDPLLIQSLGNPFIFRCIDGVLLDGNDKKLSKFVFRSCSGRDRVGPYPVCDNSWLTPYPLNPLAVGQYVNNRSHDISANVAYQEFDIPEDFPFHLRQYIPNVFYRPSVHDEYMDTLGKRLVRVVVLVSVRPIQTGEELFSSYFTVIN
ncbi:hypothetical protein ScPMuIL_006164 [Solemya velum]